MRIKIEEKHTERYNKINMDLGKYRNELGDLLFSYEKDKKRILEKAVILQQDLENTLINIIHKYKLKNKKVLDVNIEEGYIEIEDKENQ